MKALTTLAIVTASLLIASVADDVSEAKVSKQLDSICKKNNLKVENFQRKGIAEVDRGLLKSEHYFVFVSQEDAVKVEIVAYSGMLGGEIHHMVESLDGNRI